jgi:hypothetical protein
MSARPLAGPPPPGTARSRAAAAPMVALVLSVVALAAGGIAISAGVIERGAPQPAVARLQGPFGVSQRIPTTFGAVSIDSIVKINGLTAKKLAGVTHGISNYVPPNKVQVQASVTLTNLLSRPVDYSPTQFRLLVGRKRNPVPDMRASFRPGTLQPTASISGQLRFVAPRTGSRLWIQFTEPELGKPILVDIGKTGRTPAGAFDGYHRHQGGD